MNRISKFSAPIKVLCLAFAVLSVVGAAQALDGARVATADSAHAARRHAAAENARADASMQAMCREVLVDVDEGYGVTNRESRFVCDEGR